MDPVEIKLSLPDETATARLGEDIAAVLRPGDLIALHGDLGAGKTTLARGLIRAFADDPDLEVPSPTFTLVQSYQARFPVFHFDLYRLAAPEELDELGLDEALDGGAAIVEWPQNGGDRIPADAIHIELHHAGEGRKAVMRAAPEAIGRLQRSLSIRRFLDSAGCGTARRTFLLGDASTRAYETVQPESGPARILMNAPRQPDGPPIRGGKPYSQIAHLAESVTPFVAIAKALKSQDIAVPDIYSRDLDAGMLLIEHLGHTGFLDPDGAPDRSRYECAAELLAIVHQIDWQPDIIVAPGLTHRIPPYDRRAMLIETELVLDWYVPFMTGKLADASERDSFEATWNSVLDRLDPANNTIVLRDFHSPNLIWRSDRKGYDRLGVLDFQDAVIGPPAYDVASLAQDARVTIPDDLENAAVAAYCRKRAAAGHTFDEAAFRTDYAIMAAQRNSKLLGIFVRLDRRDGKPVYLTHLQRIRDYMKRNLAHPALEPVRNWYERMGLLNEKSA
jgi:tRNA threonylcarbamoyl adenosine modification protein YjeE